MSKPISEPIRIFASAFHSSTFMFEALKKLPEKPTVLIHDPAKHVAADILICNSVIHAMALKPLARKKTKLIVICDSPNLIGNIEEKKAWIDAKSSDDCTYLRMPCNYKGIRKTLSLPLDRKYAGLPEIFLHQDRVIEGVVSRIRQGTILDSLNSFLSSIGDKVVKEKLEHHILDWVFGKLNVEEVENRLNETYNEYISRFSRKKNRDSVKTVMEAIRSETGSNLQKAASIVGKNVKNIKGKVTYGQAAKMFKVSAYDIRYLSQRKSKLNVAFKPVKVKDLVVKKPPRKRA